MGCHSMDQTIPRPAPEKSRGRSVSRLQEGPVGRADYVRHEVEDCKMSTGAKYYLGAGDPGGHVGGHEGRHEVVLAPMPEEDFGMARQFVQAKAPAEVQP